MMVDVENLIKSILFPLHFHILTLLHQLISELGLLYETVAERCTVFQPQSVVTSVRGTAHAQVFSLSSSRPFVEKG